MAEVKKKFSQLDPGSVPFEGTEILAAVQGGITKRGTISGIHGAGWWDKLKAAFVDFVAPEALHANDADTIGGETSAELHNAGALIGTAPLSVIPAQLTGKNAATATSAAKLTNARTITITGDATGSVSFDGSANKTLTLDVTYATSAGSAGYATNAGYAASAGSATNAGYATSAGSATTATTATIANRLSFYDKPATMSSSGAIGRFAVGGEIIDQGPLKYYLYICVANNTWRRVQLSTF